jgi:PQQ-like domain
MNMQRRHSGRLLTLAVMALVGCDALAERLQPQDDREAVPVDSAEPPVGGATSGHPVPGPSSTPDKQRVNWVMNPNVADAATGDVDGDAHEDFIGLCTVGGHDAPYSLCAFSGADWSLLWRYGEFKRTNFHATRYAVSGQHALFVDDLGKAHVVELRGGREVRVSELSERANDLCAGADPKSAWAELADGRGMKVPLSNDPPVAAKRPAHCRQHGLGSVTTCMALGATRNLAGNPLAGDSCANMPLPPTIDGFIATDVSYDSNVGALRGLHGPGTPYPMVAAFQVSGDSGTVLWKRPVVDGSPLASPPGGLGKLVIAGGRVITTLDKELVALDDKTGKTLWRTPSASFMALAASTTRVYVGRWSRLDVRDASTGQLLGGVGMR